MTPYMIATVEGQTETLGYPIPPLTSHGISVSLPTWQDFVDHREGVKRVRDAMASGYPRMTLIPSVRKLASICEQKFAVDGEKCVLFPSKKVADQCRIFILNHDAFDGTPAQVRLVQYFVSPGDSSPRAGPCVELHIVFFPADVLRIARQFWQYTGLGISPRFTAFCLSLLLGYDQDLSDVSSKDQVRCGQDSPLSAAQLAKTVLRRRIAGALERNNVQAEPQEPSSGVLEVAEDDVFLYPAGMAAIWNAHQLCLRARPLAKSVCFGFPYADTLKLLENWGPGVHFFGHGLDSDIDTLDSLLAEEFRKDPTKPPVLALFTEFPSNPLLRSTDIRRLRALADKYDFLVVVDETIGNFVNVDVLPYADILVSSLTKVFSGNANVMGGSLVINPNGRHYATLKGHMFDYEDTYYAEDAIVMELNSRKFIKRIRTINENAQAIAAFLYSRSAAAGPSSVIKEIFYPKYTTPANYLRYKQPGGGFGGLMSLTFTSLAASRAFFDALPFHKGPTLGTNFTLTCPFTVLAHYPEREWAAEYGVEEGLVRISVGIETKEWLFHSLEMAVRAAESTR